MPVRLDTGDKDVPDCCANGHDEDDANIDEKFSGSMADKELATASEHQIEGLLS
jgi:hypothetical protein